jgi:hypothetical protein
VVFVGVEYPYLAILAVIAFTMAVSGLIYFFINTYTEALKTPILSTYAQACYTLDNKSYLEVVIKHERGLIVNLQRIEVYSDSGAVVYTPGESLADINVTMEGFDRRLGPGQVGYVKMSFPSGYFTPNKTYSGVVLFDAGNTVFTFQVVKCPFITYPYPTTLLNLGLTASTGTILALGLIKTISLKPDIQPLTRQNIFYNDTFDTTLELYDEKRDLVVSRSLNYIIGGEVYTVTWSYTPGVEFTGLAVGIGQLNTILLYNITDLGSITLVQSISANSVFNGSSSIVIGSGAIYLLNTSGVYIYDYSMGMWRLVTSACRASGRGAGIGVVGDGVVVVPGVGNNSLCVYNTTTGSTTLYLVTDGDVTEYTCLASSGYTVYVSLLSSSGPVIVAYNVSNGIVSKNATYSIRDYRLYGLTHDGSRYLYFIIPYGGDYGGVYRLDTLTGETYPLPILLWPAPVSPGDRLEYYSNSLIYARDEGTDELYLIPLEYVL